jgi:hypothetical protein
MYSEDIEVNRKTCGGRRYTKSGNPITRVSDSGANAKTIRRFRLRRRPEDEEYDESESRGDHTEVLSTRKLCIVKLCSSLSTVGKYNESGTTGSHGRAKI